MQETWMFKPFHNSPIPLISHSVLSDNSLCVLIDKNHNWLDKGLRRTLFYSFNFIFTKRSKDGFYIIVIIWKPKFGLC